AATVIGAVWIGGSMPAEADERADLVYASFNIDRAGPAAVAQVKETVGHHLAIEADDELILLTTRGDLAASQRSYKILPQKPQPSALFLIRKAHDDLIGTLEGDVVAKAGRMAVLQARSPYLHQLTWHPAVSQ